MRFGDPVLYEVGQNFGYQARERCSVMPPTPDCHSGHAEDTRRRGIAAKTNFEEEIMPAAGQTAFEVR
jgi:hypothetical protein